jgi:catechol 2,3-dioxygenase-like lactoylglutathione lyase family enzyme
VFLGKSLLRGLAAALLATAPHLAAASQQADPMAPTSSAEDRIVSPLATISIAVADLGETRKFFQGGLGLIPTDVSVTGKEARRLAEHWGLPPSDRLNILLFANPYASDAATVRAVEVGKKMLSGRPELSSRYVGPLGFGLPMTEIPQREEIVSAMGFKSTAGISRMNFARADGSTYPISEIHFRAPDDILVLGVDRGEQAQIGPVDPVLELGGVAYSSFLVEDLERSGAFLRDVLGLELRRQTTFRSAGSGGGMQDMRKGEEVAFNQWFSPGARTGYMVEMKLLDGGRMPRRSSGFATRGIAAYTFTTKDLVLIAKRWRAYGGAPRPIFKGHIPGFGRARAMMLMSPDGMPVEIIELRSASGS